MEAGCGYAEGDEEELIKDRADNHIFLNTYLYITHHSLNYFPQCIQTKTTKREQEKNVLKLSTRQTFTLPSVHPHHLQLQELQVVAQQAQKLLSAPYSSRKLQSSRPRESGRVQREQCPFHAHWQDRRCLLRCC